MATLKIRKVDSLPGALEPSTVYFIRNTGDQSLEVVMTDATGSKAYSDVNALPMVDFGNGQELWGWGDNSNGRLGCGDVLSRSVPIQTVTNSSEWSQISSGGSHGGGIKTDRSLWLWGFNGSGRLGDNTTTHRSSPIQTISGGNNWSRVAAGYYHTAAIKTDGSLWLWGDNTYGRLGDNTLTHRSSPIQTISGGTNWSQVSAGDFHTAAIKTDGSLWLWGYNAQGRLGDNSTTARSSPVQTISGGTNWSQVAAGGGHTAAIKTDGSLWLWGYNDYGQLGNNANTYRSSPTQTISGGNNWSQVATGNNCTVAIKTDGSLWLWGYNAYGNLGDNTITHRLSPIQTISGGNNWSQVAAGDSHTAAIKTDGSLWLWGNNTSGRLGDNTIINRSSPIQTISGGSRWLSIAIRDTFTLALKSP